MRKSILNIACDGGAGDGTIDSITESTVPPCIYTITYAKSTRHLQPAASMLYGSVIDRLVGLAVVACDPSGLAPSSLLLLHQDHLHHQEVDTHSHHIHHTYIHHTYIALCMTKCPMMLDTPESKTFVTYFNGGAPFCTQCGGMCQPTLPSHPRLPRHRCPTRLAC
jgi:hypothetical protein